MERFGAHRTERLEAPGSAWEQMARVCMGWLHVIAWPEGASVRARWQMVRVCMGWLHVVVWPEGASVRARSQM
eukprot:5559534-Pyramimonas_sp.AAC.1